MSPLLDKDKKRFYDVLRHKNNVLSLQHERVLIKETLARYQLLVFNKIKLFNIFNTFAYNFRTPILFQAQ